MIKNFSTALLVFIFFTIIAISMHLAYKQGRKVERAEMEVDFTTKIDSLVETRKQLINEQETALKEVLELKTAMYENKSKIKSATFNQLDSMFNEYFSTRKSEMLYFDGIKNDSTRLAEP